MSNFWGALQELPGRFRIAGMPDRAFCRVLTVVAKSDDPEVAQDAFIAAGDGK